MPRKTSSQWDFGELFPPEAIRRVFSVTEITGRIRNLLEGQLGDVWVSGEVSNLRTQSSGHVYFTLKDPNAQLCCVLFRGVVGADRSALQDGQRVVLEGNLTVYEPRGQYQLLVRKVEAQGIGALQAAFERLKQKLATEGLFDAGRKRPLPRFPRRVGLVTSPTGAALRDVLHVIGRRFAGLELVLASCRVQGAGAELEIVAALRRLNAWSASRVDRRLDVILLTRGGGSLEDLWAFNEEIVARAIAASAVAVVSAVGHEIDFTIADFVADLRAATPSAAAELLTAGYVEARETLERQSRRLRRVLLSATQQRQETLAAWWRRLRRAHPRRRLEAQLQRLDEVEAAFVFHGRQALQRHWRRWESWVLRLRAARPGQRLDVERGRVGRAAEGLRAQALREMARRQERLKEMRVRLRLLSPLHVLARGYSITLDAGTGRVLRRADEVAGGQVLRTRLQVGEVTSVATPDRPGSRQGVRPPGETYDQTHGKPAGD
jgi:exodeoxyribonuclease VII large subunit